MVDASDARGDVDVAGLVEVDITAALGDPGDDLEWKILSPIAESFLTVNSNNERWEATLLKKTILVHLKHIQKNTRFTYFTSGAYLLLSAEW